MADNEGDLRVGERASPANPDNALPVFLFYLLVDVSGSMAADLPVLNQMLMEFRDKLRADPVAEDCILFSVLSFGSTVRVEVPLGNFATVNLTPDLLKINGSTRYSEAFRTLKATIEHDLAAQKDKDKSAAPSRDRFRYYRPAVFFLTDGEPNPGDPWQQAFTDLKAMPAYPLFVPFGFRHANDVILRELVHPQNRSKLYYTRSHDVAAVLSEMLDVMFLSILSSAYSVSSTPMHVLPTKNDVGPDVEVQQYEGGDWVLG
jgi:uncharacterized protein YegL